MAPHKYAVFFPEGTGYLQVRSLGDNTHYHHNLVWSVADGKAYVRVKRSPRVRPNKSTPPYAEVKHYRDVKGVPKLIHSQHFEHLDPDQPRRGELISVSSIWSYLNGGNLSSFLAANEYTGNPEMKHTVPGLESPEALEIFAWHFFDQILQVYHNLHAAGVAHGEGYYHRVFLHFPDKATKLPDIYLTDFERAGPIDQESVERELAAIFINLTFLMSRRDYDIERMVDCRLVSEEGVPDPKFSTDLLECRRKLGRMCYASLMRDYGVMEIDVPEGNQHAGLPELLKGMEDLRALVAKHARQAKAKAAASSLPNLCVALRRDHQKPHEPKLFDSRADLLRHSVKTGGPWHIAAVDLKTFQVLAVEKTQYNLHFPDRDEGGKNVFSLRDKRRETGVVSLVEGKRTGILVLAEAQDQAKADEITDPIFELDPQWNGKSLDSNSSGKKPTESTSADTNLSVAGARKRKDKAKVTVKAPGKQATKTKDTTTQDAKPEPKPKSKPMMTNSTTTTTSTKTKAETGTETKPKRKPSPRAPTRGIRSSKRLRGDAADGRALPY